MQFDKLIVLFVMLPLGLMSCDVEGINSRKNAGTDNQGLDDSAKAKRVSADETGIKSQTIKNAGSSNENNGNKDSSSSLNFSKYLNIKLDKPFIGSDTFGNINAETTKACGINQDTNKCRDIALVRDANKRIVELGESYNFGNNFSHNTTFTRDDAGRIANITVGNSSVSLNYSTGNVTLDRGSEIFEYSGIPLSDTLDYWGVEKGDLNSMILRDDFGYYSPGALAVPGPLNASNFYDSITRLYSYKQTTSGKYDSKANLGKIILKNAELVATVLVWYAKGALTFTDGKVENKLLPLLNKRFAEKGALRSIEKFEYNDNLQKTELNSYVRLQQEGEIRIVHTRFVFDPENPYTFKTSEKKDVTEFPIFAEFK